MNFHLSQLNSIEQNINNELEKFENIELKIKNFICEFKNLVSLKEAYGNIQNYSDNIFKLQNEILIKMDEKKLVEFAQSFDKFSEVHQELQDKLIEKKQSKINEFTKILNNFQLEYETILEKQNKFIEEEQNKM